MISSLRGQVLSVALDHAVVEVGGVGLAVRATPATLATLRPGAPAALATSLVVREDALTLYGFADTDTRDLFALLQTVSGVGPRLALAMLAVLTPDALRTALADGNVAVLTQVPGIGRKGAERLVVELRDRVGAVPATAWGPAGAAAGDTGDGNAGAVRTQVTEALVGLGFPARQAEQAVAAVLADGTSPGSDGASGDETGTVLRRALTRLGRSR